MCNLFSLQLYFTTKRSFLSFSIFDFSYCNFTLSVSLNRNNSVCILIFVNFYTWVRHAHSPSQNAISPLRYKITFWSVSLRITHFYFSMYALIKRSTTGMVIVFSCNAFTPSARKSPIRTRFKTTSTTLTI